METVGVRELKQGLSRYLKRVKFGESIIVTDRKKQIAILTPLQTEREEEKIFNLVKKGVADWSGTKPKGIQSRIRSRGQKVSEAVLEDRR